MTSPLQRVLDYIQWHRTHWIRLDPQYQDSLLNLLALLRPQQAKGMRKIRVGADRDGGYVMLDDLAEIEAALSLGIGPDVSWDLDLAERGIPVWQFDHTISAPPRAHPLFHFEPKKIVARQQSDNEVTLPSLLQGVTGKQLLLKIDIEGDEWNVLAQVESALLGNCRQIVMEFHDFLSIRNPAWTQKAQAALLAITRDYGVVHVHGNNLSKHILLKDHCLPDSLEVTFAHQRFYNLEPTDETFPGAQDKKNNRFFPDFQLGRFQFYDKAPKAL